MRTLKKLTSHRHFVNLSAALSLAALCVSALAQSTVARAEAPKYKVGDQFRRELRDRWTGLKEAGWVGVVTAVNDSYIEGTFIEIEGTWKGGPYRMTTSLQLVDYPGGTNSGSAKFADFPLELGKKWNYDSEWSNKITGMNGRYHYKMSVVAYETIKVRAGEFEAFKVEGRGSYQNLTVGRQGRASITYWYAPAVRAIVKSEYDDGRDREIRELVEVKLHP